MLPDYLVPGLPVVLVGTAVGEQSFARGHHYAGRGNSFRRLLHEAGLNAA
jgi:TDG/mug DNA glycosylase family protein